MAERETVLDYEEMERVARAATPGPWENSLGSVNNWHDHTFEMEWVPNGQADDADGVNANYRADAEFIATFDPPTVPALLAERRELIEDRDRLIRRVDEIAEWVRPPKVRSIAGIHSAGEQLLVVKSHRWKSFLDKLKPIRARATLSNKDGES